MVVDVEMTIEPHLLAHTFLVRVHVISHEGHMFHAGFVTANDM